MALVSSRALGRMQYSRRLRQPLILSLLHCASEWCHLFADGVLGLLFHLLNLVLDSLDAVLQAQLLLSTPLVVRQVSVALC